MAQNDYCVGGYVVVSISVSAPWKVSYSSSFSLIASRTGISVGSAQWGEIFSVGLSSFLNPIAFSRNIYEEFI